MCGVCGGGDTTFGPNLGVGSAVHVPDDKINHNGRPALIWCTNY